MREIKQSTAVNVMVFMADSTDHITGKTGLTLTVTISKDGAAFGSITPTVTERGNGWYNMALVTGDTGTVGDLVVRATATGADPGERTLNVVANVEADSYAIVGNGTYGNSALNTKLGTPASSVSADVAAVKTDTGGLRTDYTMARAGKLDNLDANVGSRMATFTYTAPDNTNIGLIKAKTDGLPADPASNTQVNTRLAASGYTAPDNTSIVFIQKWILNKLIEGPSNTWKLYDDDNTTVLKTWTWDVPTTTRSKAL